MLFRKAVEPCVDVHDRAHGEGGRRKCGEGGAVTPDAGPVRSRRQDGERVAHSVVPYFAFSAAIAAGS